MYVLDLRKWQPSLAKGQEHFFIDAWFEAVSDDTNPHCSPPLYSTRRLLANLSETIRDIQAGVLKEYHARDLAEEILARLAKEPWIHSVYRSDTELLAQHVRSLHNDFAQTKTRMASVLAAFLDKVQRADPILEQAEHIMGLCHSGFDGAAGKRQPFAVIERATADLVNDLMHLGHARGYLHQWCLRSIVGTPSDTIPYAQRLCARDGVGPSSVADYRVMFRVLSQQPVPDTPDIHFSGHVPGDFRLPHDSPFRRPEVTRVAVVDVPACADWLAACDQGRRLLRRYFGSTRLDHLVLVP